MKERERERNITRDFNTQHTRIHIITATRPSFRMNERPFSSFFDQQTKRIKKKVYSSFRHHKFFLCRFLDDAPHIKCVGRFSRRKRDAFPRIPPPEEDEVLEEEEEEKEEGGQSLEKLLATFDEEGEKAKEATRHLLLSRHGDNNPMKIEALSTFSGSSYGTRPRNADLVGKFTSIGTDGMSIHSSQR